ncbi:MAG: transcriptional regulator [Thermobacillus sp.]|uniref:BlaI/MecI/CopY family transcriptional regulator n=1 Tax=Thermobacillus sp. TaxID=2108467 RepID=UPI000E3729C8|nr:BlaI/MecI/CopY family transcriptional regulator [Thermobacillus sp.]REK53767.1 MAG: transcriptional regulator [Thermobacillus sp.]
MGGIPRISDAEWEVMQVLWAGPPPMTAQDVIERLAPARAWSPRTVKTLLNRLLKKGAVRHEARGKMYVYFPAVSEEACVREERRHFLHRIYGGALTPMIAHLLKDERLTREEIEQLKRILDEKAREAEKP